MEITVIGCGRWGSFLAWYLDRIGHAVTLYGRKGSEHLTRLSETRQSGTLTLGAGIGLTDSLSAALRSPVLVVSVNAQGLRSLCGELREAGVQNRTLVLCMKGIETPSGKRLSEITAELLDSSNRTAVWLGPGHVQEFAAGVPNCMVIDSGNEDLKKELACAFSSDLIRFYYGTDLIGNEVGAAAKNVIGLAAGVLDGLGLSSLKGALMARGTREIARLIRAMGGDELSAYGLCHLGDYEATVFSKYSRNRAYGEALVKGEQYGELAEGCSTAEALMTLSRRYGVELPICSAVYRVLYCSGDAADTVKELFLRDIKHEF